MKCEICKIEVEDPREHKVVDCWNNFDKEEQPTLEEFINNWNKYLKPNDNS